MSAAIEASAVIEDIASAVSKGECILFLGAGVHSEPPSGSGYTYPEDDRPPFGSALSKQLAERCKVLERYPKESVTNLQRMSLFFEMAKGRKQLVEAITSAVHEGKKPSPALRGLAELDFPLVITTNYDRLFERALGDAGKEPVVSIYSPEAHETEDYSGPTPTGKQPFVCKIHGDVGRPDSIVITDEDYIKFVLRMSDKPPYDPVPMTFRYFFQKWTTLFVGYSLVDYNLRLLFKTLRWRIDKAIIPDAYSVDLYPDPLIFDVWHNQERYVRFVAEDIWKFVPALYSRVRGEEMPDFCG
jgi:hypothetical protein